MRATLPRPPRSWRIGSFVLAVAGAACSAPVPVEDEVRGPSHIEISLRKRLARLSPEVLPPPPPDVSNRFADNPAAAALGKKFFFEKRFSGPLLDDANDGQAGTLGLQGETGKVSCSGCHIPEAGFLDVRSPRAQISLGSAWTRRRAPSLLGVSQMPFLMWDGRHDTAFSQPFTPLEDPLEINSSRLFVAQQVAKLYRAEYEAVFGALPGALDQYEILPPEEAGCTELPEDIAHGKCDRPGSDDPDVTGIVVNVGKAIQAYTRQIQCGRSRFDRFMDGELEALTPDEEAGALLFVGKAKCDTCHSGPYLTDFTFHNVGLEPDFTFFVGVLEDEGASGGIAKMLEDPLNSKGPYSDGYDGRHDQITPNLEWWLGAFKTPSLRCVSRRPSYMHTGEYRSLEDVVLFFNRGGDTQGFLGVSENHARDLTPDERRQLVAFLRALDGDGPDPAVVVPPELPPDP